MGSAPRGTGPDGPGRDDVTRVDLRRGVQGLLGAAAMIAVITVLSRVLGLARVLVQAGTVGADDIANVYNAVNLLPNILFETAAGGALAGAVVPLIAAPIAARDRERTSRIAGAALGWTLLVLVPLGLLLAAAAGPIAEAFGHGDPTLVAAARYFVLVFSVQVPLYGLAVLLYAVLQAHKRFFWPAFAPVLNSLVVIAAYLVYGGMAGGERVDPSALPAGALGVLAWGTTAGVAAMVLPVLLPVRRLGVRLRPTLRFPPDTAGRFRALALAGIGSVAAQQVSVAVGLWLATNRLPGGDQGYTAFMYAQQVYLLPYAVLVVPLATSTFPRVAAYASTGDRARLAHAAAVTTRAVLAVAALGAAAVLAGGPALASVFAGLARQDGVVTGMTAALVAMAPGVVGLGVLFHVSRTLYAVERPRAAIAISAVAWAAVTVASIVAVLTTPPGGIETFTRLGLGTTVGMSVGGVVALVALRRAVGAEALTGLPRTLLVVLAAAGAASVLGRLVADAVLDVVGDAPLTATGAAAGGAVVATAVVAGALALLDRSTLVGVMRVESASAAAR